MAQPLPSSDLSIERAPSGDERVDTFYFGPDDFALEVEEDFKSRIWEEDRDLWLFFLKEELVAGARLGFRNLDPPHAEAGASDRRRYHLVLSVGVNVAYQGRRDSQTGRSLIRSIFGFIVAKARAREGCVGVSLWVRAANTHAVDVYRAFGFEVTDEFPDEDYANEWTYEMKLWF